VYAEIETGDGVRWATIPAKTGQLWRSDDGGDTWQLVNSDRDIRGRTHYYTREEISPDNENEVYFFSARFRTRSMAARRLPRCRPAPAATTTKCGSIRRMQTGWRW